MATLPRILTVAVEVGAMNSAAPAFYASGLAPAQQPVSGSAPANALVTSGGDQVVTSGGDNVVWG